jgi:UDP-glucose 4-epimerase
MSLENSKAIVFGANGFLGQNLIYWLLENKFEVLAVDRSDSFTNTNLSEDDNFSYIKADLTIKEEIKNIPMESADVLYILAALTGTKAGFAEYSSFVIANEILLLNILNVYCEKMANGRLVFPSSRLVYKGKKDVLLKEDSEKEAKTVYAANKIAGELYLACWANAFNIHYTIFRICVPYGQLLPGEYSFGTLGFMISQAKEKRVITLYGDGSQNRTFSHVADICELLGNVPFIKGSLNKTINIGSNDNFQLLKLAKLIAAKYNATVQFKEWPELDLLIESGDTMFDDESLQSIYSYTYKRNVGEFINELK